MKKATRYRIYPSDEQQRKLAALFGQARYVFNHYLAVRSRYYKLWGKGLSYKGTARGLVRLKKRYEWLNESHSQVLQQALRDLDRAFVNFFKGRAGYPNFKKKSGKQSLRYPNQAVKLAIQGKRNSTLWLSKIGEVKLIAHKPLEGRVLSVTVTKTKSGRYYAAVCMEVDVPEVEKAGGEIGIDVGLKHFAVLSSGEKVAAPRHLRRDEKRIKRLQRRLARRQKGGRNREKARLALAKAHEKVAARRADFLHQLSTRLARQNAFLAVEDLNVAGMLANHRLAKSIADASWSAFFRQLAYKGIWFGCQVHRIPRFEPSSKTCSICGYVHSALKLKERTWTCPACGSFHDRDINAAINILAFATRARLAPSYACGESTTPAPCEQGLVETGIGHKVALGLPDTTYAE